MPDDESPVVGRIELGPKVRSQEPASDRQLEEALERVAAAKKTATKDTQGSVVDPDLIDPLKQEADVREQGPPNPELERQLREALERAEALTVQHKKTATKDTNPKDAVGIRKWRVFTTIPFTIMWELGVAMLEGARKYGRHNYRVAGVRGSVYIDAAMGHLTQWWEGEDLDPDTGLSHITKAIASLAVMRDAMINGRFLDDRPPKVDLGPVRDNLQERVDDIFDRIPDALDAYVEGDQHEV